MILIEQLDENVIYFLTIFLSIILIILSWLSTNVREFVFPGNLLVIERRSRRLYATSVNGNLNRIINTHQLSPSLITTTSTTNPIRASDVSNLNNSNEAVASMNLSEPPAVNRSNQIDLVDEMVEQALVDNLLDGTYYTANNIDLVHPINNSNIQAPVSLNDNPISDSSNILNSIGDLAHSSVDSIETEIHEINNASELLLDKNDLINILIKFVNEKEMKIQARPDDTILLLKRTHFSTELNSNKIVRFIYQGQFLCDKNTIKSYNIKDQTTIHCHITSKQPTNPLNTNDYSTNSIRQRINSHQISSIARITGAGNQNEDSALDATNSNNINTNINAVLSSNENATSIPTSTQSTINSTNSIRVPLNRSRSRRINPHHHMINTATIINVDLTNIFLPFFAVLLGSFWYIRVHFKHFFTPFSTLVLILISFIYALFLFNNIYTSSFVEANHLISSRIFSRRNQPQAQNVEN